MVMQEKNSYKVSEYIDLVQKVARVEFNRIPSHMLEYEELLSIGIIAIQSLIKSKTPEQLERYNNAYIATAVRWAIRNELRIRYKWYSLKHREDETEAPTEDDNPEEIKNKIREAVYETVLSIEGLSEAASENDSPFDFLKDNRAMPDENAEISEMGRMVREAISTLPAKERTVVEYRFYRNMQVKDIARQVGLSSSRITRIVQASLNHVREYLQNRGMTSYE